MTRPSNSSVKIAITMGDPCGIGPEVTAKALSELIGRPLSFVLPCDPQILGEAVKRYGSARLKTLWATAPTIKNAKPAAKAKGIQILARPGLRFDRIVPGKPKAQQGRAAWKSLEAGLELVTSGLCGALVTAPVHKASLMAAGFPAPGHTDWLAAQTGSRAVMMLAAGRFRVVPLTAHLALSKVPKAITRKGLLETIAVVDKELRERFGVKRPRIAVSGLNPHAGEEGKLGKEEIAIIEPAMESARKKGMDVRGPFPADTMFTSAARKTFDAAVTMYHDQAMLPIKTLAMHRAVNVTLGLPIIRTSPAHGTAPEIAWQGKADPQSMIEAIELAAKMAAEK